MATRLEEAFPLVTIEEDDSYHRFICHQIILSLYERQLRVGFLGPDVDLVFQGRKTIIGNMPTIRDFRNLDMTPLRLLTGLSYSVCAAAVQVVHHFDGRFENTDLLPEKKSL